VQDRQEQAALQQQQQQQQQKAGQQQGHQQQGAQTPAQVLRRALLWASSSCLKRPTFSEEVKGPSTYDTTACRDHTACYAPGLTHSLGSRRVSRKSNCSYAKGET